MATKLTNMMFDIDQEKIERYTPKNAVDLIIPYLSKDKVIWAPFSENYHHFANYLREQGFKVINTHLNEGKDFLTFEPDFHFDMIIDNPPFKNKTKFVERAISFKKPFALFLPMLSISDNGIPNLFIENDLEIQLLIPNKRTEFIGSEKKGVSFKTIYICNEILPKQIILTKMKK